MTILQIFVFIGIQRFRKLKLQIHSCFNLIYLKYFQVRQEKNKSNCENVNNVVGGYNLYIKINCK